MLRFREDKNPEDWVNEADQPVAINSNIKGEECVKQAMPAVKVNLSNLDKVYWKATGDHGIITKGDLINYYDSMSNHICPNLRTGPSIFIVTQTELAENQLTKKTGTIKNRST